MALSKDFVFLPLDQIEVPEGRQRREVDTRGLKESIASRGVLNPIIISRANVLVAGERRLAASKELGLAEIPCRYADDLSEAEAQIIELEENIKRQDLPWPDQVLAVAKIHFLYKAGQGKWEQQQTAEAIGLSPGTVSMYLAVFKGRQDPRVAGAKTVREAYDRLNSTSLRGAAAALQEILDVSEVEPPAAEPQQMQGGDRAQGAGPPLNPVERRMDRDPAKSILWESFLHWAPKYQGPKFNLIHCDWPKGQEDLFMECLFENLDKLLSVSGHLMIWGAQDWIIFPPGLVPVEPDLVWHRTDAGQGDTRSPKRSYETCTLLVKGKRPLVRSLEDCYAAPGDRKWAGPERALPEPMLRHFLSMLVDETTSFLDPTCGSGSALRAAESLGAKHVLGLDIDEQTVGQARQALRAARTLRGLVA